MGHNWSELKGQSALNLSGLSTRARLGRATKKALLSSKPIGRKRLHAEVATRLNTAPKTQPHLTSLSKVEIAMRKNAPDLAGASQRELLDAQKRRTAHEYARWPRPRLLALCLIGAVGILEPNLALRLGLWGVVLFLVGAIATGPERARDTTLWLGRRFMWLWRVEVSLCKRLLGRVQSRLGPSIRKSAGTW